MTDKDEWDKIMGNKKDDVMEAMKNEKFVPADNELLRITVYRTKTGGIASKTLGLVKGTKDLLAVNIILTDVLKSGMDMLAKHKGVVQTQRDNISGEFKKDELDK